MKHGDNLLAHQRRVTREVMIGRVGVGGANPIRVQSMITCDTMDTEASIAQTMELAAAGCEIVRITAPTVKDSANLEQIGRGLRARGCDVPIVADIHFKPEAALEAAKWVEKVRINPGNYADSKKFKILEYTDEQYAAELERIRERFTPLVRLCRQRGIAMRIGTNHGSLSDRIMNRYGDTPLGMVESALEFARIARDLDYHAFVFSMKSSNPKVMINAYRLLAARLEEEGDDWNYPIHLGVTEAGEGEDARIKSAIGIGSLLHDGIGDTIRVSLTGPPEDEVRAGRRILQALELRPFGPMVISCPTCGRTGVDVMGIAEELERRIAADAGLRAHACTVAVMGCVVNGPGEARAADVGFAGGKNEGVLFKNGEIVGKVAAKDAVERLLQMIGELRIEN